MVFTDPYAGAETAALVWGLQQADKSTSAWFKTVFPQQFLEP